MSTYGENLEVLADYYVDAVTLSGEERTKEGVELYLFLQKLYIAATPDARTQFLAIVDFDAPDYPWSALYSVGESWPPALILLINEDNKYNILGDGADPSYMEDAVRVDWEKAGELAKKMSTGWLPDEWKADDDDTVIIDEDEPAPKPRPKPKPTEPKSTEPKPTEPKPTEPKPTETKPAGKPTETKPKVPTGPTPNSRPSPLVIAGFIGGLSLAGLGIYVAMKD